MIKRCADGPRHGGGTTAFAAIAHPCRLGTCSQLGDCGSRSLVADADVCGDLAEGVPLAREKLNLAQPDIIQLVQPGGLGGRTPGTPHSATGQGCRDSNRFAAVTR